MSTCSSRIRVTPAVQIHQFLSYSFSTSINSGDTIQDRFSSIPPSNIRNYAIIAHVDHGKSSLASRLLEFTRPNLQLMTGIQSTPQVREDVSSLDTLSVERERGITVKSTCASILHFHPPTNSTYLLNFVDTPGHVDFSREVSRTLTSVEGALLLFDGVQGVQAQSLAVYKKAEETNTTCIPVITKADMADAREIEVSISVSELFGFDPDDVVVTSARENLGILEVLNAVVERVPPPVDLVASDDKLTRVKIVDSWYEIGRGVVCLVQVKSGEIREGDKVVVFGGGDSKGEGGDNAYSLQELGLVLPERNRTKQLKKHQFGYAIIGMKNPRDAKSQSIFVLQKELSRHEESSSTGRILSDNDEGLIAEQENSVLFASVHPEDAGKFEELCAAVERLALNDTGLNVSIQKGAGTSSDSSASDNSTLGPGLKIGFQGLLHVEIFRQRLSDEFGVSALVTNPKVKYIIKYMPTASRMKARAAGLPDTEEIEDLGDWPEAGVNFQVHEPIVKLSIMAPHEFAGKIMELLTSRRSSALETTPIDDRTWLFTCRIPWAEVVSDFHDSLKNVTAGFASFDIEPDGVERANLNKVDISLNGDTVNVLSFIAHADVAQAQGRSVCKKLETTIPRAQFPIAVQAKVNGKVIARTTVKPYRKDVLTKGSKTVGGGDISRKKKVLEKQKAGKKRMKEGGNNNTKVRLSQEAFTSVITR